MNRAKNLAEKNRSDIVYKRRDKTKKICIDID